MIYAPVEVVKNIKTVMETNNSSSQVFLSNQKNLIFIIVVLKKIKVYNYLENYEDGEEVEYSV